MGFTPSPYLAVRHLALKVEYAQGDPREVTNLFYYSEVKLNLLCSDGFDPSLPWIYKWNGEVD